jgi:serine/arginine repetitive matrix protein 2
MFSFGLSSVLGNRENPPKKTRTLLNEDNWYLPYNGPCEAPPRDTPQRWKQRDSWGDPIPFGVTTDNLELNRDGDVFDKRELRQHYEPRDIKYGVRGVFDDDWKRVGTSGVGRVGVASDEERGRRASYGRDQRPSSFGPSNPVKSTFSTKSRRRSTTSSGNSLTVPNYLPLDGVSGGVGESPVPQRRSHKDANRISLGTIFTFGSKMRVSSSTRSMDGDREEREENIDVRAVRPTSNPEKGRVPKSSVCLLTFFTFARFTFLLDSYNSDGEAFDIKQTKK